MVGKEQAIIFDVDGTLAHMTGRIERHGARVAPFMDKDAHDDTVDEQVAMMARLLAKSFQIIICSGRKDSSREVLKTWLVENDIPHDKIFMRKHEDNRKDSLVKHDLYSQFIEPYYDVHIVFDDRNQVIELWRDDLNLKTFQVANGNF
jgi:phosphoglycolate phosphatase-like HAD superfamily hydrolase